MHELLCFVDVTSYLPCVCTSPFVYLSVCLPICLHACLYVCMSVRLSTSPLVHLRLSLFSERRNTSKKIPMLIIFIYKEKKRTGQSDTWFHLSAFSSCCRVRLVLACVCVFALKSDDIFDVAISLQLEPTELSTHR